MAGPGQDFARLLAGAGPVESALAAQLLDAAGIPSLVHGPDFDVAELGVAAHQTLRGADLYVPRSALERARQVLDEAWGEGATAPPPADPGARDAPDDPGS